LYHANYNQRSILIQICAPCRIGLGFDGSKGLYSLLLFFRAEEK